MSGFCGYGGGDGAPCVSGVGDVVAAAASAIGVGSCSAVATAGALVTKPP